MVVQLDIFKWKEENEGRTKSRILSAFGPVGQVVNHMYCRKCGAEIEEGASVCGFCGSKVEINETGMQEKMCPVCRERVKISRDYPYCPHCGKNLSFLLNIKPAVQVKENKAKVVKVEDADTQELPVLGQEEAEDVICPNCGRKVRKSVHMHRCMYCGAELNASDHPDQKTVVCSGCGRRITITKDKPYCPYCGNDLSSRFGIAKEEKTVPAEPEPVEETDTHEVKAEKKKGTMIAVCILIAVCVVLVIFIVLKHAGGSSASADPASETASQSDEAEKTAEPVPTETASAPTIASEDYILPDSGTRLLNDSDVEGLSLQQINYAKNEIYARHGRKFNSRELQDYFNSKSWYNGTIDPDDFTDSMLSSIEQQNVQFLSAKEYEIDPNGYSLS